MGLPPLIARGRSPYARSRSAAKSGHSGQGRRQQSCVDLAAHPYWGRCVRRRAQARHQLRRGVEASAACGRIYRLLGQRQWRVRLVRDSWNARTTARKQRAACWLKPKSGRNRYRASIAPEPSCSDHAPPRSCGQLLLQAKKPRHGAWHPTASPTVRIARLGRREGVQDALRCQ